jgi:hypothetical protein
VITEISPSQGNIVVSFRIYDESIVPLFLFVIRSTRAVAFVYFIEEEVVQSNLSTESLAHNTMMFMWHDWCPKKSRCDFSDCVLPIRCEIFFGL